MEGGKVKCVRCDRNYDGSQICQHGIENYECKSCKDLIKDSNQRMDIHL